MFIDFQRAIDSIRRFKLVNAQVEIEIDIKLILLIKMKSTNTYGENNKSRRRNWNDLAENRRIWSVLAQR